MAEYRLKPSLGPLAFAVGCTLIGGVALLGAGENGPGALIVGALFVCAAVAGVRKWYRGIGTRVEIRQDALIHKTARGDEVWRWDKMSSVVKRPKLNRTLGLIEYEYFVHDKQGRTLDLTGDFENFEAMWVDIVRRAKPHASVLD